MAIPEWTRKAGGPIFIAICVIVAIVLVVSNGSSTKSADHQPTRQTNAPTTIATGPSQLPVTGGTSGSVSHSPTKAGGTAPTKPVTDEKLLTNLSMFIGDLYFITPEDNALTRAKRMPSFVHAKLNLDTDAKSLGLNAAGQAMRTNQVNPLTIHGYLKPQSVAGTADPAHGNLYHVSGVAEISFNQADGSVYSVNGEYAISEAPFTSTWQKLGSTWVLVQFTDNGGGT